MGSKNECSVKENICKSKQLELASEFDSDQQDNSEWDRKGLVDFMLEKLNLFHLTSLINLELLM